MSANAAATGAATSAAAISTVDVHLAERSYAIDIGSHLLDQAAIGPLLNAHIRGRHVLLVSNETPAKLFLAALQDQLRIANPDLLIESIVFADGERSKTLANAEQIFVKLAELKASRDVTLIALGGGVIGDLTGFAAALWMRGVAFLQVPTTLLAMVDSSVGGKTAVNLTAGKNLVGAFWQPAAVIADLATLRSLAKREYAAGIAEIIKYGAIADAEFFAWLETNADALKQQQPQALLHAVRTSCQMKAGIVQRDERETGERMLLNFGHTFGHALEAAHEYRDLLHGEAVAIGMLRAAILSSLLGLAGQQHVERLRALLQRFDLPTEVPSKSSTTQKTVGPDLSPEHLLQLMKLDKKNRSGEIRLILWRGIGQAFVGHAADADIVQAWQR